MASDELSNYYADLLVGGYDCVDRIVLNAHFGMCYSAGGFRTWWRRCNDDSDQDLDDTHLMRMAGRFSRRVRGWAKSHSIPVIDCPSGERKHKIAEEYLKNHPEARGVFMILVGRAGATVWDVKRSSSGVLQNLVAKRAFVNHYSFHIVDPDWGHITIKMAGHPPFGAQIMLNGHEYVACQARKAGIGFTKEGNCFTMISKPTDLAQVADPLSEDRTVGRLSQVCERWIYTSCLCFALDREEQQRSGFGYQYSVYQVEYSRNLIFHLGGHLEQVFQGLIDRTRARLDVKQLKTIFGRKGRPHRDRKGQQPRLEVGLETPTYDLTIFKLHFGKLTLKAYSKGEHVLRFEAIVHNTRDLGCGRVLDKFPHIVTRLRQILEQFWSNLYCMDQTFISDDALNQLPHPARVGQTQVGGLDLNRPRIRAVLSAALAVACSPQGFTASQFAAAVQATGQSTGGPYDARRAAYDLKKLRGKQLAEKVGKSHRYRIAPPAVRTLGALVILREKVLRPILAGVGKPKMGRKPKCWSVIDEHYETIRQDMFTLFEDLRIAA